MATVYAIRPVRVTYVAHNKINCTASLMETQLDKTRSRHNLTNYCMDLTDTTGFSVQLKVQNVYAVIFKNGSLITTNVAIGGFIVSFSFILQIL